MLVDKKVGKAVVAEVSAPELEAEISQEDAKISKTISMRFPSGFVFTVSVADGQMTIDAQLRGKQCFFLDQIPKEFIGDLKSMLREF